MRFSSTVPQTKLGPDPEKVVTQILREYKIVSADVLAREEISVDQLVDVIIGKFGHSQDSGHADCVGANPKSL